MTDNANWAVVLRALVIPSLYRSKWEESIRSGQDTKKSLPRHWQSFIDSRVREWSTVTATGTMLSLTWLSLLPFSTNIGRVALLCTGPGILCASASVFTSLVYVRNRHLLERIMQDKGVTDLPFNLWTFLSLPSLYFAWSLLLLGLVLFLCLFTPGHQLSWSFTILGISVPVLSTRILLLITLIPCSLIARNFQVLSQAVQQETTSKPSEPLKPMDLSSPSDLESTELVTLEKVLGLIPIVAHTILGFSLALLAISDFYNDPIMRISLIIAITSAFLAVILHLQASLRLSEAHTKRVLVLPVSFLALSALAFLISLLAHFWTD